MALYDINGNLVASGGDSFFEEVPSFVGGLQLGEIPSNINSSTDEWEYLGYNANENSFYQILGNVGYMYKKRMFTGTVYLRNLTKTPYTSYSGMGIKLVQASDFLENPSGTAIVLEPELFTVNFEYNDDYGFVYVGDDGTVSDEGYAVALSKYVIPDGYYGVLYSSTATTSSMPRWVDKWVTMFTLDPSKNITQIDTPFYDLELMPTDALKEGFIKWLTSNEQFQKYFAMYSDNALKETSYFQTKGKSLYVGGDSLHAYAGDFIRQYNKHFGFKRTVNGGYAGSTWSGTTGGGGIKQITDILTEGTPYDVFILAWGTNDDSGGNGTIDDEASNTEGCTMVSAMKWCINQLRQTFRYSAIGIIIPPPKTTNEGMKEKGDLMIQVCEQLHVPYVDMRKLLSMDDMSGDGIHLGYGANKYGAAEAKLILDICPYGDPLQ